MNVFKLAIAALSAATLAGCAQGVTAPYVHYEVVGTRYLFHYAAGGRDFHTVIYGNPSAASKQAFDAAVIAAMQGRNWGPNTNFTTTPSESAREGYRVVMVFSGDGYISYKAVCGYIDPAALATVAERVVLLAAFCYRDRVLSVMRVYFSPFTELDDQGLDRAVAQAVLYLFPLRDPFIDPGDGRNVVVP